MINAGIAAPDAVSPSAYAFGHGLVQSVPLERLAGIFVEPCRTDDRSIDSCAVDFNALPATNRVAMLAIQGLPLQP